MKLADAIRLGSMLKPQGFHLYGDNHVTCALGAANEAAGRVDSDEFGLFNQWPLLQCESLDVHCPAVGCSEQFSKPYDVILHLNDEHRWTREVIAGWVEALETRVEALNHDAAAIGAGSR